MATASTSATVANDRFITGYNSPVRWILLLAACASTPDSAPPCTTVGGHFYQIARDALAATPVDDPTRKTLTGELDRERTAIVTKCRDAAWRASVRTCMTRAADQASFVACEGELTEAERPW
jgi:hypothetical protein